MAKTELPPPKVCELRWLHTKWPPLRRSPRSRPISATLCKASQAATAASGQGMLSFEQPGVSAGAGMPADPNGQVLHCPPPPSKAPPLQPPPTIPPTTRKPVTARQLIFEARAPWRRVGRAGRVRGAGGMDRVSCQDK